MTTVDEGQANGSIAKPSQNGKAVRGPDSLSTLDALGIERQRLAEARVIRDNVRGDDLRPGPGEVLAILVGDDPIDLGDTRRPQLLAHVQRMLAELGWKIELVPDPRFRHGRRNRPPRARPPEHPPRRDAEVVASRTTGRDDETVTDTVVHEHPMDPRMVKWAVELKLIGESDAPRFLAGVTLDEALAAAQQPEETT